MVCYTFASLRPSSMLRTVTIGLLLILSGCAVNPVTGEKQLSIMPVSQEIEQGKTNYLPYQQQQGGRYVVDPDLNFYVASVGKKLAQASGNPNLPYEFVVLNNSVPNAWALPGGKIAINRGLLVLLEDEAQLAAVLGHEVVHSAARHGATQQTRAALLGMGAQVLSGLGSQTQYGTLLSQGVNMGAGAWQAKYGRDLELESDDYGMRYMEKTGYEPQAAVELQKTFLKLSKGRQSTWLEGLLASHPPSQERVTKNQQRAKTMRTGVRNKGAYQRAIAQIKKDEPAYKAHSDALQAISQQSFDKAHSLLDQAIRLQPKEALFHVAKGQIFLSKSRLGEAEKSFSTAQKYNPDYVMTALGMGLVKNARGDKQGAKSYLLKSLKLLPTATATYHLGEIEQALGNRDAAIAYYEQTRAAGGELGKAAEERLSKLQN